MQGNKFVVALKDYLTRESTLLSFKRGDIVKLMDPEMNLEKGGWSESNVHSMFLWYWMVYWLLGFS